MMQVSDSHMVKCWLYENTKERMIDRKDYEEEGR